MVARERADQDRPARFRAQRLRKELGLPYWREHVEEVVSRHGYAHDRRNRENAVHDGRAADPHFRRREVGQLNFGFRISDLTSRSRDDLPGTQRGVSPALIRSHFAKPRGSSSPLARRGSTAMQFAQHQDWGL